MRHKLQILCLCAVLAALCLTTVLYLHRHPGSASSPATAGSADAAQPPNLPLVTDGVSVTVGDRVYKFTLHASGETIVCGAPQRDGEADARALRTRTVYRFPVTQNGTSLGAVTLTLDQSDAGTVFYLQSGIPMEDGLLQLAVETAQDTGLTARPVAHGESAIPDAAAPLWDKPYPSHAALYLESDGVHLRTARLSVLHALGQTVYQYRTPSAGVTLSQAEGKLRVSIPLSCGENEQLATNGVLTAEEGVHWGDATVAGNVANLDASATDYRLLADGVYVAMPEDYSPREGDGPHIYRTATAWLLGPCTYESNGPMFTAIGKSIVYSYLDHVNERGFLPTAPTSGWLKSDFGIGGGFYDTRFNFDTMKRLMHAEAVWDDPEIGETVQRMLKFYCAFADRNQFDFLGHPFVPDYADADGNANGALSSLNHYLSEGLLLLRAGDTYGNSDYSARGWRVLNSINATYYRWIRDNADLWYGVYPDGWLRRGDYVEVTYNDLLDAAALLSKYGRWENYEGIQKLLHEKERWLRLAGRPELLQTHAAFTFAG
ncbi:MAG: hypothetical protein AB7C89_07505 [Intestinibacillus sp.]